MTFDESPSPLCSREKWGASLDPCWLYQSSNITLFRHPLSGNFVFRASWISEVTLICSRDILLTGRDVACGVSEKCSSPYHRGQLTAPWPASIWHWRRKERQRVDPATCAHRWDTWCNVLSQWCSVAPPPHTALLMFCPNTGLRHLRWGKSGEHWLFKPLAPRWRLHTAAQSVICIFNLHLGWSLL